MSKPDISVIEVPLEEFVNKMLEQTGQHFIREIVIDSVLGKRMGLQPGEHIKVLTNCGEITVRSLASDN